MIEELMEFVEVKPGKEEELASYLSGKLLSPEGVKSYLETSEGRKLIQPLLDRHFNKGIETWKANNLSSIIEDEVSKRNPAETEDQRRIRRLEEKLRQSDETIKRGRLENIATKYATEKGIPLELVPYFVGADEEATETNLENFSRIMGDLVNQQVKTRFKDSGRVVQNTRQVVPGELEKLKSEYALAIKPDSTIPLQQRIAMGMRIQEIEKMKE